MDNTALNLPGIPTELRHPLAHPPQLRRRRARRQSLARAVVLTAVLSFFMIPLVSMAIFSVRFPLTGAWTGRAWQAIFGSGEAANQRMDVMWEGLLNSLGLMVFTVVLMLGILLPTMLLLRLRPTRLNRIVEFVCLLPLTIPAIVLVVGLAPIYRFIAINIFSTATIWLAFAYVVLVLPYSYRALDAGFSAIEVKTLVEAARSLGCGWLTVMFRVIVPNMRQAILSACFISIAVVLGEYTIAALLNRTNLQVGLFLVGQSDPMVSTAMSLLALLFGIGLLLILGAVGQRQKGKR